MSTSRQRSRRLLILFGALAFLCVPFVAVTHNLVRRVAISERSHPAAALRSSPLFGDAVSAKDAVSDVLRNPVPRPGARPLLEGTVVDDQGVQVEGAAVGLFLGADALAPMPLGEMHARGRLSATDGAGSFALAGDEGDSAAVGVGVLAIRHECYATYVAEVTLRSSVTIRLQRGLRIAGQVLCGMGHAPAANVVVAARGVGAAPDSSMPDRFPPPTAAVRTTISGPEGTFLIDGCQPGWYQVEAVAEGLTSVVRPALDGPGGVSGPAWARAGDENVTLTVLPVAAATLRLVDSKTGYTIPYADFSIRIEAPAGFERLVPIPLCLSNGVPFGDNMALPQSVYPYAFITPTWPIRDEQVLASVEVPGYGEARAQVPLVPLGRVATPHVLRLDPDCAVGGCVFELRDRSGRPAGPTTIFVGVERGGIPAPNLRLRFDERGRTEPLALSAGDYVGVALHPDSLGPIERAPFLVRSGESTDVTLQLAACGILVEVVDQRGVEIDGYGLRIGPGHEPVAIRRFRDPVTGSMVTTGLTYPPPGRGTTESIIRFLVGENGTVKDGPATVEAFRHGYERSRTYINLVAGEVSRVRMVLSEAPDADWRPRVSWDRVDGVKR